MGGYLKIAEEVRRVIIGCNIKTIRFYGFGVKTATDSGFCRSMR